METKGTKRKYQKNSFSILTAFFCLVIVGFSCLPLLNVQLNPTRDVHSLQVSFHWHDVAARIIETEVTSKLEGLISTVQGVASVGSFTTRGYGQISIELKNNVNIDMARFEIANLLRQSYPQFPPQVSYPYLSQSSTGQRKTPLLVYTVNAPSSPFFIQRYTEEKIVPALSSIKGLGEVSVYGATPYRWEITYNTDLITRLAIPSDEIEAALNSYFRIAPIGTGLVAGADGEREMHVFLTQQPNGGTTTLEEIPIKRTADRIIYLKDIATARFVEGQVNAYYRVNGLNTVNLTLFAEEGVNHLALAKKLRTELSRIATTLPEEYSLLLLHDESEFINKELSTILQRFLFSFAILFFFVLLVSRSLKYLLLIFFSIFVNLIIAVAFYYLFSLQIHLYSLAGITISLGIIIDNCIIMVDHLRNKGDKKVLLAIIAATMTTIGALSMVFLLKEEQKVELIDFALVTMINLVVSTLVAMYFIPALMEKFELRKRAHKTHLRRKRRIASFTSSYQRYIRFGKRFRWAFIVVIILAFGIPVHWLPEKIESENALSTAYNETLGSEWFRRNLKPSLEKVMGGGLRLFTTFVFENSFYSQPGRTTLHISGTMPEGCTLEQLNEVITKMESFISRFDEVEIFKTSVTSYRNSDITIYFKEEHEWTSFPHYLKNELESKAISLGGLDWSVYGVGRGFSNALSSGFRNSRIVLKGYNYDQLIDYAGFLRADLLKNPRIKEVDITGPDFRVPPPLHEYYLDFYPEKLAVHGISRFQIFNFVKDRASERELNRWGNDGSYYDVVLKPDVYGDFDVWNLKNSSLRLQDHPYKFSEFGSLEKRKSGVDIHKWNQQYQLFIAYDFIGPDVLSQKVLDEKVGAMNEMLPLGFSAEQQKFYGWQKDEKSQYYLVLLVIVIIFAICSVLFNSLRQPFAIICLIPISFIGVFLTFYLFDINFDQGGFASFILVAGLVVNAGIYVANDYNNFRRTSRSQSNLKLYCKAFNYKIIPILLTVLSTILGLVPFLWNGQHEVFWYSFAAGAIGGLSFSVVAVLLYLPLFSNTSES